MTPRVAVVQIDLKGVFKRQATQRRKRRIGQIMLEQVIDRVESGGDEEEKFAPLDFTRPNGSKDNPLNDTGTHLLRSLAYGFDEKGVWVGSNFIGAAIQNLGTVGKGGTLPTIRPVIADALFLPLTPRAAKSVLQFGWSMSERRRVGLQKKKGKRVATTLEKGVDFKFISKADIRPRRFLKLTEANKAEIRDVFAT